VINVAICVPSLGHWEADFGVSLASLCLRMKCPTMVLNTRGSMLPTNRETLVRIALEKKATHLLFLDSDMHFPPSVFGVLNHWDKDFVAANCVTKRIPAEPTAKGLDGNPVYSDPRKIGLEEVQHVGLAVALIKAKALKGLSPPLFDMEWRNETGTHDGEDVYLCKKLRKEKGIKLWVDHELSRQIRHVGSFAYSHRYVGEVKRESAA